MNKFKQSWKLLKKDSFQDFQEMLWKKKLNQAIGLYKPTTLGAITSGISNLSGILLEKIMPSGYRYLLVKGERYETGSDYSQEDLKLTVDQLKEDRLERENDIEESGCEYDDFIDDHDSDYKDACINSLI